MRACKLQKMQAREPKFCGRKQKFAIAEAGEVPGCRFHVRADVPNIQILPLSFRVFAQWASAAHVGGQFRYTEAAGGD
jgi:hypothetical protein